MQSRPNNTDKTLILTPHKKLSLKRLLPLTLPLLTALITLANPDRLQKIDRHLQGTFATLNAIQNPHPAPPELVIVAIDDDSLAQLQQSPPLKRELYARAITRLMDAGARAIALDVIFDLPSPDTVFTAEMLEANPDCSQSQPKLSPNDQALRTAIEKYQNRLILGIEYERFQGKNDDWNQSKLVLPYCPFRFPNLAYGSITVPLDKDNKVHQFGDRISYDQSGPQADDSTNIPNKTIPSLALALIQTAQRPSPKKPPTDIPYLALPGEAFRLLTIPLWHVLSDENWNSSSLESGKYFKDKLILIGGTAQIFGDRLETPVGKMAGLEIHAHAAAALLQSRDLKPALAQPWQNALLALIITLIPTVLLLKESNQKSKRSPLQRSLILLLSGGIWITLSYATFSLLLLHLPTALPTLTLTVVALLQPIAALLTDRQYQAQLRKTLKRYGASPLIQEIIEQQPDPKLQNLLQERQEELQNKTLGGRYKITHILSSGGFSETYLAQDIQLPGQPTCVVKQLRPRSNDPKHLRLARRLFDREAKTLLQLGSYDRIPQLMAYFEEDEEFYLIQQYIPGNPLSTVLTLGRQLPEITVLTILTELLQILDFVHKNNVLHRDIKPSNIIQRTPDQHLVLIDFGAVKALETFENPGNDSSASDQNLTIGIGTQGYMAPEQQLGNPCPQSDLYSIGILGIQALTGLPASQLLPHPETQIISWHAHAHTSITLASILNKLTQPSPKARYSTAIEALIALLPLLPNPGYTQNSSLTPTPQYNPAALDFTPSQSAEHPDDPTDLDQPTRLWSPPPAHPGDLPITAQPPTLPPKTEDLGP